MTSPSSRDSFIPLVDATGVSVSSDEHRAEVLANKRQGTLRHGRVSVYDFFSIKKAWRWRGLVPFSSFSPANGSSLNNISLWEDSGFVYPRNVGFHASQLLRYGPNSRRSLEEVRNFSSAFLDEPLQ